MRINELSGVMNPSLAVLIEDGKSQIQFDVLVHQGATNNRAGQPTGCVNVSVRGQILEKFVVATTLEWPNLSS